PTLRRRSQSTSSLRATTQPLSASQPKPLPWPLVGGVVLMVLALLAFFTLYLPGRQAAQVGNTVNVQDLTVRVTATPSAAYAHGVEFDVTVDPVPAADAIVEVTPTMPTMGNMAAQLSGLRPTSPGGYHAVADLGMGGLWQVQVTVHRPGQPD